MAGIGSGGVFMGTDPTLNDGLNPQQTRRLRLDTLVRSDCLPELLRLASLPAFAPLLKNVVQIRVVLDAHVAQQELRWRLGRRRNPSARTRLHVAIAAGVIVPFAPPFLDGEIEEHVHEIADATRTSVADVRREWQEFRKLVHFYAPRHQLRFSGNVVDVDDVQYIAAANELGVPIYSTDRHYRQMNAPVISVAIATTLQSYARASSVRIAVMVGSTFSVTLSFEAIAAVCRALKRVARWFDELHPAVQLTVVAAAIVAFAHPQSRTKLAAVWQWIKTTATPPVLQAIADIAVQFVEANRAADAAYAEIQSSLPRQRKRSAMMHARAVCLVAKHPLSIAEMERRIRAGGYISRARDFRNYLRRMLRSSGQFIQVGTGLWALCEG